MFIGLGEYTSAVAVGPEPEKFRHMEALVRFHCSTELSHQEHWESFFEDRDSMLGGMMELIFFYPDSMPGAMMGLIFSYVLYVLLQGPQRHDCEKYLRPHGLEYLK
jgi:hypothetical protein